LPLYQILQKCQAKKDTWQSIHVKYRKKGYNMVILQSRLRISRQNGFIIILWRYVYKFSINLTCRWSKNAF